jgi:small subunit ribosomal protein S16
VNFGEVIKKMVVIRLSRGGTNKRPFYTLVAADSRKARDGRYIEQLGYFNPIASGKDQRLKLDKARVDYWVGCGAKLSDRVADLLREMSNPQIIDKRKVKKDTLKTRKKEKTKAEAAVSESSEEKVAE